MESGITTWDRPSAAASVVPTDEVDDIAPDAEPRAVSSVVEEPPVVVADTKKRPLVVEEAATQEAVVEQPAPAKRPKVEQVRALHILKKHKDSRRPSSWRKPKITETKEEARQELQELLSVLQEVRHDPAELQATFEELARTESDCSSAKRGGDLGYFGRKKMQPAFEEAAFELNVGQMSDIVDTSSGLHIIMRIG
jgi:NIMA-interacting peptidyl-prolyl cis-trans isomerase 1